MSAITAAINAPKVIPPSSPFGELLRRSRFAAYDPAIRQTYSAPPSYAHRGNWGLKRPISNRSKRGAIVLRKFEEHAQYIEWDRADHQVKVIKAVEEMNTAPGLVPQTSWFIGLGQAATSKNTGFDSEFCPGEPAEFERYRDERYADEALSRPLADQADWSGILPQNSSASTSNPRAVNFDTLGKGGKGAYGGKAPVQQVNHRRADETLLQPNINAMTPVEFKKYLEDLRKLRPLFIQYLREQLEKDQAQEKKAREVNEARGRATAGNRMSPVDPKHISDAELILKLGKEATAKHLHMAFLGRYTEDHTYKTTSQMDDPENAAAMANRPSPIRKQPHKLGGLMYAMPTELESLFSVKPQPGLILQDTTAQTQKNVEGDYLATLGPLTVKLPKTNSGTDARPLYSPFVTEPIRGIQAPRMRDPNHPGKWIPDTRKSERPMRAVSIKVEETPVVVGEGATNKPLSRTRLRATVAVDGAMSQMFRTNSFTPGTLEYSAQLPPTSRISGSPSLLSQKFISKGRLSGRLPGLRAETSTIGSGKKESETTLTSLQNLLQKKTLQKKTSPIFRPPKPNVTESTSTKTESETKDVKDDKDVKAT